MTQPRLLAILAHPDDESFGLGGTLARYARQGIEVQVCIVTDGGAGVHDPHALQEGQAPTLARLRLQELECACGVSGVHLHTLDYRDSGMEGAPENDHPDSLYQADLDDVAHELVRVICQTRPHVVITHDPSGGYFHPDHVKVNRAVRRAWASLGDAGTQAALRAEGEMPFREVLSAEGGRLTRRTVVVAISPSVREEWVQTVLFLDRAGLRVVTVLVDAASFGGPFGADRLQERLLAAGGVVILLRNGDSLQEALNVLPLARTVPVLPSIYAVPTVAG